MKCVIVVDQNLPRGLIANTSAVLGLSLGSHVEGLIGSDLLDSDGQTHLGLTNIPIPILMADKNIIKDIYIDALKVDHEDFKVIDFTYEAQTSLNYDDYHKKLKRTTASQLEFLGFCLYGPKKKINRLTGQLKMLR